MPPDADSRAHLDLTTITTGELKRALNINAELGGADSEKGIRLVNIVRVIKSLREALAETQWAKAPTRILSGMKQLVHILRERAGAATSKRR